MENGIPQYEATTEYFAGSVVQYSNQYYKCLVDGTVGVTPAVVATWQYITDATYSLASNSGHNVATGTTIQTQLDAIDSYIYNSVIPVGTILPFSGSSAPSGFLFTDGSAVNRTGTYANLFSTIGTTYGAGNLTTTFNIPDTRGIFLRGVGTNPSNGSNVTTLGARQLDAFNSHTHTMNMWNGNSSAAQNPFGTQSAVYQGTYTSNATGDTETRPANLGVNHIIKY
jgi:microcystin-dependent protein